jgi:hypothetical protein
MLTKRTQCSGERCSYCLYSDLGLAYALVGPAHALLFERSLDLMTLELEDLTLRNVHEDLRAGEQQVDLLERLALRLRAFVSIRTEPDTWKTGKPRTSG